ncbi:MAG: DUF3307 domain-containing protein [Candidatus Methanoperedens sp.]|nr:DUF3307 domain-containing protein [Candidatus Methanoperedens sp.]
MITQMEISLLIRLITSHLVSDFLFQSDSWVKQRFNKGWFSKHLYMHGIIGGLLAYLLSGLWSYIWIPITVGFTHILIDGIKVKYEDDLRSFLADQFAHFIILLGVWLLIINPKAEDLELLKQFFLPGIKIWVIIGAYFVIIWPSSVLISKITEKWREDISEKENNDSRSLEKAGRWIGILERFLILTFVLLEQYAAIGFLVAAKSIFRFSESRKAGEYVLIGTLLSFTIAIIVGLIVNLFY